jgi:hypothetical protein
MFKYRLDSVFEFGPGDCQKKFGPPGGADPAFCHYPGTTFLGNNISHSSYVVTNPTFEVSFGPFNGGSISRGRRAPVDQAIQTSDY